MSEQCKANTRSGQRCQAAAVHAGLCALHADPGRAAELGRLSGQSRRGHGDAAELAKEIDPPKTSQEVRTLLGDVIADVRARKLDTNTANAIGYIASVMLRSIEVADVEQRVAALETVLRTRAQESE